MSAWKLATALAVLVFFTLSVRWSYIDNSPPAWDQGLYLYQAASLHHTLMQNGLHDFILAIFNIDRGRVPLLPVVAQPAFYIFGPSLDVAVISLNFAWFLLAWALPGIARELAGPYLGDKAGFFAFVLFGCYPLTVLLSHNYLVELLLVAFICAAIYSLVLLCKTREIKWSVFAGIFISLGLLTKVTFPVFVLPAFVILAYRMVRNCSVQCAFRVALPAILIPIVFAGPYYLYNIKHIIKLVAWLSSRNLSQLYGFGGALDVPTIINYWRGVFVNPAILVAVLFIVATMFFRRKWSGSKSPDRMYCREDNHLIILMIIWFAIPFMLATCGEIKDPRYIYPGLVPIFVFAGVAAARNSVSRLGTFLIILVFMIALPGYLYSNNLISAKTAVKFASALKMDIGQAADAPPDHRDWMVDNLVQGIACKLDALQENKSVLFLGGNRYYHLRLLDFEGLLGGFHLTYIVLPYYANPSMSLDEALKFIADNSPAGILYKSGENWPPFSSHLDSGIVAQLKKNPKYTEFDLGIVQPDGSRFTLFIDRTQKYVSIKSASDLVGSWKVGGGLANIAVSDVGALTVTTETGVQGFATIQDGVVYVPGWDVSGRVTSDFKYIHWSNGSVWNRVSSGETSNTSGGNP